MDLCLAACVQSFLPFWVRKATHLLPIRCSLLFFLMKNYTILCPELVVSGGLWEYWQENEQGGLDFPGLIERKSHIWLTCKMLVWGISSSRGNCTVGQIHYSTSNSFTFHRHWSTGINCWCANNPSECVVSDWIISWAHAAWPSSQPEKWLSHWPCKVVWFRCLAAASPFYAIQSHQCRWTGISAVNSDHWVGHLWFFRLDKNVHSQDFTSVCFLGLLFLALCARFLLRD